MAKSKSIHPISGKLRENVYVDSKDGYIVRSAPKKRGRKKKMQPAFDSQANRAEYINGLAGELNSKIKGFSSNFKQTNFYRLLLKRFRREPLNNRYILLKQLERMEVNERYPLHKLGGARLKVTPKASKIEITVAVDYHPPSSVAKRTVNCYEYQVLLLCWVKGSDEPLPEVKYGEWRFLKDKLPVFDFLFKRPAGTVEWLVCLRQRLGFNEEAIPNFRGEGMQIVLAGSFEDKDLKLWEKRQKEKMEAETMVEGKRKENVVRVKARE
ncbi:hypothetical protein LZZ85_26310 [Terrimonas sp. NA20]|uniref:Uncharacterized protein n=1 Tax=Terrimonas ginsenosidimutans TaxID=2908004 RepID=A0ABS9KZN7_9BACT|nr:hypothetical protein [Terrimonas ginsenosidimutans]MCG2617842.1 hypothetical protein [Terrimonas ginsenosidimutans]